MKSVQVRVPATTANLGPGFDAMGIALRYMPVGETVAMTGGRYEKMAAEGGDSWPKMFTMNRRFMPTPGAV